MGITAQVSEAGGGPRVIPRRPHGESAPLSLAQEQIWLHAQLAPGVPLYNEVLVLRRTGPLNRDALGRSLGELIRRQEALRTTFPLVDGVPVQAVGEHRAFELPHVDLSTAPDHSRHSEAQIATEFVRRPFDLVQGPLLRTCLLRPSPEDHILVIACHALIADEWSLKLLAGELAALYEGLSAGKPIALPDLPIQYTDYSYWQKTRLADSRLDWRVAWWKKQLAGVQPVLELPADRPRPRVQEFHGSRRSLLLSKSLSESARKLAAQEGVSLFMVLMAAFQVLLWRYTAQDEMVLGSIVWGRDHRETEHLIGPFASTLLTHANLGGSPPFRELLQRVKHNFADARRHQDVPFIRLASELQPQRDPSRNSLFQVLFSLEPSISLTESGWTMPDLDVDTGTTKVDLHLQVYDRPEGLESCFTYNSDLFDAPTMLRMAGHFETLLGGAVATPNQLVSRLPLLSAREQHQLLVEWNNTQRDYPRDRCLHQFIEAQVERSPDAMAVVFENTRLSYRELNARANQLAHYLLKVGVGPDVLVGICVERSLEMVIGLLGILKAGGAYMPLDPEYPRDRLSVMLEDSSPPVVLTQQRFLDVLPDNGMRVLCLDSGWERLAEESTANPVCQPTPKSLAYVIYTSGSTGKPKGVLNTHEGIVNRLLWMQDEYLLTDRDRVLQKTPYTFDVSVWEFFWPLMTGACLVMARPNGHKDPSYLVSLIVNEKITTLHFVPSMLQVFLEADGVEKCVSVRRVICSGEALPFEMQERFFERLSAELHNLYGPTETAVDVTYWACSKESKAPLVPIGRPIANTQIYVLDKCLQPVPVGVAGELHIGGIGLARGYLNRAELTAEKFIPSPFDPACKSRLYKTGDLARFLPDGAIEYIARMDHQVKIRGFRIELGEIEAAMRKHPAVNETVVMAREDVPGDKRLVAYFVPKKQAASGARELRDFLKQSLPEYMVPSAFVALAGLPLTPNGKVDRRALPRPEDLGNAQRHEFVAPRDAIESELARIWEEVLAVRPIGSRHDFFEFGGHSLLAVRLMHRIEHTLGKRLPLATLFQAPTIEQLAHILRDHTTPSWSSLVPIQPSGSKQPLFCVHGAGGNVLGFYDLARYLGEDQPVYGLQAQGIDGKNPYHTRVEEMAAHYINEIRSAKPNGPYFLAGYSFGGVVAFEMAQQLRVRNQEVALVVLFDTFCRPPRQSLAAAGSRDEPRYAAERIFPARVVVLKTASGGQGGVLLRTARALKRGILKRLPDAKVPRILKGVRKACEHAARNYVPQVYPGRVVLFRSSERPLTRLRDPHAAWRVYAARGLEIYEIAGDHDNILHEPQVRLVASQLKRCLESANSGSRAGLLTS